MIGKKRKCGDGPLGIWTFDQLLGLRLAAIFLASEMCSAISRPTGESLLIRLGAWNSLIIKPSSAKNLSILQQCSWVMPTRLAIWLFCNGPCSSNAIKIFCSTVRSMPYQNWIVILELINNVWTLNQKRNGKLRLLGSRHYFLVFFSSLLDNR